MSMYNPGREDDGLPTNIEWLIYEMIFRAACSEPRLASFGEVTAGDATEFGKRVAAVLKRREQNRRTP